MRAGRIKFDISDVIIAALPLAAGASIYLLFRSNSISVFRLVEALDISNNFEHARILARPFNKYFQGFTLYSLPTSCWAFSFIYTVMTAWKDELKSKEAILTTALVVLVVQGSELAQAISLMSGTFDRDDFLANLAGLFAGGGIAYAKQGIKKSKILL